MAVSVKHVILHFSILLFCFILYKYTWLKAIHHNYQMTDAKLADQNIASGSDADSDQVKVIFGVTVERNPPQSKLDVLGVSSWPKWSGSPSKFPWEFTATETMYFKDGKVKVFCEGHDGYFEIGAGNLVIFPKGMKVTWEITEAVNKHYHLDK